MPTVTSVKVRANRKHTIGIGGRREYVRNYYVYVDDKEIEESVVRAALPAMYSVDPDDPGCIVQDVDIEQDEDKPDRFLATVKFSSIVGNGGNDGDQNPDVLARPAVISYPPAHTLRMVVSEDVDGEPLCTTIGEPFEGVEREIKLPAIQVVKWRSVVNTTLMLNYGQGAINSDVWLGFPQYTVKLESLSYEPETVEGVQYYKETSLFLVFKNEVGGVAKGWRERILNAGFFEVWNGGGDDMWSPIKDPKSGQPVSRPWPIKAETGVALTYDEAQDPANFHYREFFLFPKLPFSALDIP